MKKKYYKNKKEQDAYERFMRLCEWSYVPQSLEEDDDEQDGQSNNDDSAIGNDEQNMTDNQDNPTADANIDPTSNQMQNGDMPSDNDMQSDENMPNSQEPLPQNMDNEIPNELPNEAPTEVGNMDNEDEEVIDVDDITNAQEKMNTKVNHVGKDLGAVDDKIEKLMQSLEKMEQMIDTNNQEISQFKQEFEKRNPTQVEKLKLRSLDSYPFSITPQDYWAKKGLDPNSNYSADGEDDNFEITNNDVDNFNERDIERSFDIDDELNQDLNKIFGL